MTPETHRTTASARTCLEKAGSKHKALKVFTCEEGGYHHCRIDNVNIGAGCRWDWLEARLLQR